MAKRVLIKVSGESLKGNKNHGVEPAVIDYVCNEIATVAKSNVEVSLVVGGGNFIRGRDYQKIGIDRAVADYAGMLATLQNSLFIQDKLESKELDVRTQTAIAVDRIAEPYLPRRAMAHLRYGRVVIFACGTGDPFMSTDTAATLRALDIKADLLIMAKQNVDGVYNKDPNINNDAEKYDRLSPYDALKEKLGVVDSTALSLAMENNLDILVLNINPSGNLLKATQGCNIGTMITNKQLTKKQNG